MVAQSELGVTAGGWLAAADGLACRALLLRSRRPPCAKSWMPGSLRRALQKGVRRARRPPCPSRRPSKRAPARSWARLARAPRTPSRRAPPSSTGGLCHGPDAPAYARPCGLLRKGLAALHALPCVGAPCATSAPRLARSPRSISASQPGLRGVDLGHFLIKQAATTLLVRPMGWRGLLGPGLLVGRGS